MLCSSDYNEHQTVLSGCENTIKYNKHTKKHNVWDKSGARKRPQNILK